jgi:hypothetical protein
MVRRTSHRHHAAYFGQADPAEHMLGLPKSHPRLGTWIILTIVAGTILALSVVVLGNFVF